MTARRKHRKTIRCSAQQVNTTMTVPRSAPARTRAHSVKRPAPSSSEQSPTGPHSPRLSAATGIRRSMSAASASPITGCVARRQNSHPDRFQNGQRAGQPHPPPTASIINHSPTGLRSLLDQALLSTCERGGTEATSSETPHLREYRDRGRSRDRNPVHCSADDSASSARCRGRAVRLGDRPVYRGGLLWPLAAPGRMRGHGLPGSIAPLSRY
ncbi:Uncharacterised protein [Acidipropionibacterium jensenii]|uniref:Uncharacterized protein n=1 Tax=Acidipropionibacterium jensenii TaxID=1749 RepID=A0A448NXA8_9ACTN|nr:Uncharacterised protein [Acidipropionibacterium jensenii]